PGAHGLAHDEFLVALRQPGQLLGEHRDALPPGARHCRGCGAPDHARRPEGLGLLNDLFYGRSYIAAPAELSIPVLLDEKSTVVPVRLAGEQSGGKRKVSYGDGRSNSERAAPSACVGRRLSAPQIVWNRSTRRPGARGGPRVGRPRVLKVLA